MGLPQLHSLSFQLLGADGGCRQGGLCENSLLQIAGLIVFGIICLGAFGAWIWWRWSSRGRRSYKER